MEDVTFLERVCALFTPDRSQATTVHKRHHDSSLPYKQ